MDYNQTELIIRPITKADIPQLLELIRGMATYEKVLSEVTVTETILEKTILTNQEANCHIGFYQGVPFGFVVFFDTYAIYSGTVGLFMNAIYVDAKFRRKGLGRALIRQVAQEAYRRGITWIEWACYNWNVNAQDFYTRVGAKNLGWCNFRLEKNVITDMAAESSED